MASLSLPSSIIGRVDVSRLLRELKALNEYMVSAKIRNPHSEVGLPRLSLLLELVAKSNNINLSIEEQRIALDSVLSNIREHAPSVQVSFASNPSAAMVEKLVQWFRRETHPYTLLQTGLQPGLAAGCMLRTPNRVFDLSLRKKLTEQRAMLLDSIRQTDVSTSEVVQNSEIIPEVQEVVS